jgi:metal-sulfur cluster biosynthetic enzyme
MAALFDPTEGLVAVIDPDIGIALWSLAMTTGVEFADVFCPSVLILPVNVESASLVPSVVSVAAPVGSGRDAAEIG